MAYASKWGLMPENGIDSLILSILKPIFFFVKKNKKRCVRSEA